MNDKLIAEAMQRLDVLAAKLGVGAEFLWAMLIKQAAVVAVYNTVFVLIVICVWPLAIRFLRVAFAKAKRKSEDDDWLIPVVIAWVIVMVLCTIVSIAMLESIVTAFLNPDYWAFEKLMKLVHP